MINSEIRKRLRKKRVPQKGRKVFYKNCKNVHGYGEEKESGETEHGQKTETGCGIEKKQEDILSGDEEKLGVLYNDAACGTCGLFIRIPAHAGTDYCVSGL